MKMGDQPLNERFLNLLPYLCPIFSQKLIRSLQEFEYCKIPHTNLDECGVDSVNIRINLDDFQMQVDENRMKITLF